MGNDWDFKFKDDEEKKAVKKKSSPTGIRKGTKKRPAVKVKKTVKEDDELLDFEKPIDIKLDYSNAAKRKRRSAYVDKPQEDEIDGEEDFATPDERLMAIACDYLLVGIGYFFSNLIVAKLLPFIELPEEQLSLVTIYGRYAVTVVIFLVLNIVFPLLFKKTFGMLIFKLSVLDDNFEQLGVFKLWIRELIYKPIGLISIIGIFFMFTKDRKALWDKLAGSIVVTDRIRG